MKGPEVRLTLRFPAGSRLMIGGFAVFSDLVNLLALTSALYVLQLYARHRGMSVGSVVGAGRQASRVPSVVRFANFNRRTTPEFAGTVVYVAADIKRQQQTARSYFIARIALDPEELQKNATPKLTPIMRAEIYARTLERTALSYAVKPLTDQIARAFREH